jgi:hypothetical protein
MPFCSCDFDFSGSAKDEHGIILERLGTFGYAGGVFVMVDATLHRCHLVLRLAHWGCKRPRSTAATTY